MFIGSVIFVFFAVVVRRGESAQHYSSLQDESFWHSMADIDRLSCSVLYYIIMVILKVNRWEGMSEGIFWFSSRSFHFETRL